MAAIDLGGLPYSQIGQLQIRSRSGTIPSTIPRIGGWAVDPVAECAFVEDAGLAVPSTAVSIGALKYTPDGALYVTADTTTGPFTNIGGLKVRQDGAACIITKTPSVTLDPYIGGAAYDGATSAMVVGGAGFGFILPLSDAGAGAVNITPVAGVGVGTFTRATSATTVNSAGLIVSVGTGVARSAYDPTSLAYLGYLAEGARTNLCLQSEDFATTWVVTDTTVTVNQIAAPDGNTTADLLTCGVAGTDAVAQAYTATANTTQVFSLWCKRGNSDWIRVQIGGAGFANRVGCWFDITNGVVGTVENIGAGTGAAGTIKAYPNGWYRITLAGAPNNAETALTAQTLSATANGGARLNSATRYQWGGMVENNASFASSYIPTTTVAVTRNADVLTYGASGNASSSEGTVYLETTLPQISTGIVQQLINIDDGTGNQREFIAETGGTIRAQVNDGGVAQAQFTSAAILAATTIKTALTYKVNSFNAATSGVAQTKDTSGTVPAVTTIRFGDQAAGGQPIFGTIKNVMISQSQLTDTQLQALTA